MKTLMGYVQFFLAMGIGFYKALVFMLFFNWFVATSFGLPIIGYWLSYALLMTTNILIFKGTNKSLLHYENKNMNDEDKWTLEIANTLSLFIALNLALFIGWLIHLNI
jgi:hypothetical protein